MPLFLGVLFVCCCGWLSVLPPITRLAIVASPTRVVSRPGFAPGRTPPIRVLSSGGCLLDPSSKSIDSTHRPKERLTVMVDAAL